MIRHRVAHGTAGFTLIELAVVLAIIALLAGGILAGQSMIRGAELRNITVESQRYIDAIGVFRDKYASLPGDMSNATSVWAAATTCPSVMTSAAAGVCNGDGNAQIQPNATSSNEIFGFWEHLSNAGLIEGSYTGAPNSATATANSALFGVNTPASNFGNAGWSVFYLATIPISRTDYYDGSYGHVLFFGSNNSSEPPERVLKPEEALNIDQKIDDGFPAIGTVLSLESQGSTGALGCGNLGDSNSVSLANSAYAVINSGRNCSLIFKTGY